MKGFIRLCLAFGYQHLAKPVLFVQDAEAVHERITNLSEFVGNNRLLTTLFKTVFVDDIPLLSQSIAGISFSRPIGLAAGFDYDAKLTQLLPVLGFGFGTVGTITNKAYGGNKRPMLGRLPKSRSLMVNKGFKNHGAKSIAHKLARLDFAIPLGVSIGRTNTQALKNQQESIADILRAFIIFEKGKINNSYYELNISCPNLKGDITFYPPKQLRELLQAITNLHLSKPLFIKMPIEKTDKEVLRMLDVIVQFPIAGVIIGNLQKDRTDSSLVPEEVAQFPIGHFSGKPTWNRSNELIRLVYKTYGKQLIIIGCGGVFSAEDAYEKIKYGASLVQLITGMIYQGPQLISQINAGLVRLLQQDGYTSLTQAVGKSS
jgi:dihydroorotate dehydrogenase